MMKSILFLLLVLSITVNAQRNKPPKLVVGIVIDQMCYEYLYRYQQHFTDGGFNRFLLKGANCRNTQYNYIPTFTGPGHASIYTGTTPSNHGIVGNEWFDRKSGKPINCVQDKSVSTVGSSSTEGQTSPVNLKTYTITDQLKMTYPSAKVVSVSIKDRGAILPGGHLSDGSYWYDYSTGTFITSTYFKNELPAWLINFNKVKNATTYTKTWDLLLPKNQYQAKDESPYEQVLSGKSAAVFPYDFIAMAGGKPSPNLFTISPFANTLLTDLALEAVNQEKLGTDAQADMLCVSYSTPDIAGHSFGPYSLEMEDMYFRLDRELKRLLDGLELKFGKENIVVFLTADHAVVPVPQMLVDKKLPGGYLFLDKKLEELRQLCVSTYKTDLIEIEENLNIYLKRDKIDSLHLDKKEIETLLRKKIMTWEGVKAVFTAEELQESTAMDDEWRDMSRKGFEWNRSGDLLIITEPGVLPKSSDTPTAHKGTSHGSAFNYDTHVPLLWYGAGIPSKDFYRPMHTIDIAPTLIHLLNLQRTGAMTGEPIIEILQK